MQETVDELALRWLARKAGALTEDEHRVLQSAIDRKSISLDVNLSIDRGRGMGDRIADSIARVGGSWTFILGFIAFLIVWVAMNAWLLGQGSFDPYPFIFLNLVLSMVAALQAPIIMMSQNRQSQRDRLDAAHDYEVNLKAEIEIMALHEKLDEIRHTQILGMQDKILAICEQLKRIEDGMNTSGAGR